MSVTTRSPMRSRLAKLGVALALGTALTGAPLAAFADDAAPAAAPAAAAPAAAAPAAAPAKIDPNAVVATVGDRKITEGDLAIAATEMAQDLQQVPPEQQRAAVLASVINIELFAKAARAAKLDQSDDYKQQAAYLEDRALRRIFLLQNVVPKVTPDAVKKAYDAYVAGFQGVDQVRAAHILVKTEDEAKDIKKQLDGGAVFADLAKAKSTDTGSGGQGGELGFFTKEQMVKPFADAAFAMTVGQISDPVQSQYGWHIIKVEEKTKTAPDAIDKKGPELQQQLIMQAYTDAMTGVSKDAQVNIPDPALAAGVKALTAPPTAAAGGQ